MELFTLKRHRFVGLSIGALAAACVKASYADVVKPKSTREGMVEHLKAGVLDVSYIESGPAGGPAVVLLHGFPYDVHSYDVAAAQLAAKSRRVIVPYLRGYGPLDFLLDDSPRGVSRRRFCSRPTLAITRSFANAKTCLRSSSTQAD